MLISDIFTLWKLIIDNLLCSLNNGLSYPHNELKELVLIEARRDFVKLIICKLQHILLECRFKSRPSLLNFGGCSKDYIVKVLRLLGVKSLPCLDPCFSLHLLDHIPVLLKNVS